MPFLRSSSRPQAVDCFFCLSHSLLPPLSPDYKGKGRLAPVGSKWNWQCQKCGCWNIRDQNGEMLSDIPAMHSASLNKRSFSLRGTPSSSHLPSTSSSTATLFCHSCLANQTLIMNMLANYLPDDSDPTFPELQANLPNYLASLHARYPPVCRDCQPGVDEALRKADHRAQVEAWGSALYRGAKSSTESLRGPSWVEVLVWRIRGLLWWLSLLTSVATATATLNEHTLDIFQRSNLAGLSWSGTAVAFHLVSILWIAWDPWWLKKSQSRSRITVEGRNAWIVNMLCIATCRIIGAGCLFWSRDKQSTLKLVPRATFGLEVALLLHALFSVRVTQPIPLQLVRPVQIVSAVSSPIAPSFTHPTQHTYPKFPESNGHPTHNPIFGQPSLAPSPPQPQEEIMDWEPSPHAALSNGGWTTRPTGWRPPTADDDDSVMDFNSPRKSDWDSFGVGKQRMFGSAPPAETGLEGLLAGWGLTDPHQPNNRSQKGWLSGLFSR